MRAPASKPANSRVLMIFLREECWLKALRLAAKRRFPAPRSRFKRLIENFFNGLLNRGRSVLTRFSPRSGAAQAPRRGLVGLWAPDRCPAARNHVAHRRIWPCERWTS